MKSRYLAVIALALAAFGLLLGSVPSGAEPNGLWVPCGRALFHDWTSLPDPSCATAHQPFQAMSLILLGGAIVVLVWAASRGRARPARARREPARPQPSTRDI